MNIPTKLIDAMRNAANPRPSRSKLHFSLRFLFLLTTLSAVVALVMPLVWRHIEPWFSSPTLKKPVIERPTPPPPQPRFGEEDYCPPCGCG